MTKLYCAECEESHTLWTYDGKHTVNGGYHSGIMKRYECGVCGAITEVHSA